MKHRALLAAITVVGLSSSVDAQTCLGRVSFGSGAVRAGVGYQSVNWYGGELAYGSRESAFGIAQFETYRPQTRNGANTSSNRALAVGGTQMKLGTSRAQVCPLVGVGLTRTTTQFDGDGIESNGKHFELGGAIGVSTGVEESIHVIPSLAVKLIHEEASGTVTRSAVPSRFVGAGTNFGQTVWSLGIAHSQFAVTPFVAVPFGLRYRRSDWGVNVSYNFGRH